MARDASAPRVVGGVGMWRLCTDCLNTWSRSLFVSRLVAAAQYHTNDHRQQQHQQQQQQQQQQLANSIAQRLSTVRKLLLDFSSRYVACDV